MYLFDASAIVNLIKQGFVRILGDGSTIDLAYYESLSAVWKEYKLLGRIDWETALEFVKIIGRVFEVIDTCNIRDGGEELLELALRENLTIYDASYLFTAINRNLILVTDDKKLREKASKYVKTLSSRDLIREIVGDISA